MMPEAKISRKREVKSGTQRPKLHAESEPGNMQTLLYAGITDFEPG